MGGRTIEICGGCGADVFDGDDGLCDDCWERRRGMTPEEKRLADDGCPIALGHAIARFVRRAEVAGLVERVRRGGNMGHAAYCWLRINGSECDCGYDELMKELEESK